MEHKNQHWVPRSYLAAWCDPDTPAGQEPFVWRFDKDGSAPARKAPKNIFSEKDMYTLHLGDARDLTIEHGLAGLEGKFAELRALKIDNNLPLTPQDRLLIKAFVAAMHARSRPLRDHLAQQYQHLLAKLDGFRQDYAQMSPPEREAAASLARPEDTDSESSLSYDDVAALAASPVKHALIPMIQQETSLLISMGLGILVTSDDPGFITSDAPCVWFDPEAAQRPFPYCFPGLAFPKIEITLPVSPTHTAILGWRDLPDYIVVPSQNLVDELNRRIRFHCDTHFVVRRNITRPLWFDSTGPIDPEPEGTCET